MQQPATPEAAAGRDPAGLRPGGAEDANRASAWAADRRRTVTCVGEAAGHAAGGGRGLRDTDHLNRESSARRPWAWRALRRGAVDHARRAAGWVSVADATMRASTL